MRVAAGASTARRGSERRLSTCLGRWICRAGREVRGWAGPEDSAGVRAAAACWSAGPAAAKLGPVDHGHARRVGEPEHGCGDHPRRGRPTGRTRDHRRSRADRPADVDGAVDRTAVGVRRHLSHPSPSTPNSTVYPYARTSSGRWPGRPVRGNTFLGKYSAALCVSTAPSYPTTTCGSGGSAPGWGRAVVLAGVLPRRRRRRVQLGQDVELESVRHREVDRLVEVVVVEV